MSQLSLGSLVSGNVMQLKHCLLADFYQGMRVIVITLQKATNGPGPADWDRLFLN